MREVADVETLYNDLMDLIVRLGNAGVIHGDFNEFNIMVTDDAKPILIDFPQMVSTSHQNARMFFERDVNGVREYFRRRFNYECAGFPLFDELTRDDTLDVEVSCSGFTKEMEKDLLQEYGMESPSDEEEDESENEEANAVDVNDEAELGRMRSRVEEEVKYSEDKQPTKATKNSFNIQNYLSSIAQVETHNEIEEFVDAIDDGFVVPKVEQSEINETKKSENIQSDDIENIRKSLNVVQLNGGESDDDLPDDDELADLDPKSREYRLKMVQKLLSDVRSQRSYSTTASTIAPSLIKDRIKKTIDVKEKQEIRKRCVAKGEASAVTRMRNDNRDTCKQYKGWDF